MTGAEALSAPDSALRRRIDALNRPDHSVSVRVIEQSARREQVLRGTVLPGWRHQDLGAMVTIRVAGGVGYCATPDLSADALARAAERARSWALACRSFGLFDDVRWPATISAPLTARDAPGLVDEIIDEKVDDRRFATAPVLELLEHEAAACQIDPRIVNWSTSLSHTRSRQWFLVDGQLLADQQFHYVEPNLEVTASDGSRSQTRSLAGQYNGFCQQGGFEVVERSGLIGSGRRIAVEALELLSADNCPSGRMSLLLAPDQMMLQIHESIGHPLELDRILGDERNFAGTSFVSADMFGRYQYGSPLLNVRFEPNQANGYASYQVDDEGTPAEGQWLIRDGVLQRPLGSALSQARARQQGMPLDGVANSRACGWYRAPIDRMANINIAAGDSSLARMIESVEQGVMMKTNVSWSIDDSRNKFQFGCEWGQLIEQGRLTRVVRNPNYRGVSATFWRNLSRVGDASTFEVMGTPFCGKGEPGQVIRVGHSSPACLFDDVDVFGASS